MKASRKQGCAPPLPSLSLSGTPHTHLRCDVSSSLSRDPYHPHTYLPSVSHLLLPHCPHTHLRCDVSSSLSRDTLRFKTVKAMAISPDISPTTIAGTTARMWAETELATCGREGARRKKGRGRFDSSDGSKRWLSGISVANTRCGNTALVNNPASSVLERTSRLDGHLFIKWAKAATSQQHLQQPNNALLE